MKLYRDIQPGEMLQAGDERMSGDLSGWVPVEALSIGQRVPSRLTAWYRRPVDLPTLQPVTPEAMAELEGDEVRRIAVLHQWSCKTMVWVPRLRQWHSGTGHDNPLEWQWFIELSTLKEVQQ